MEMSLLGDINDQAQDSDDNRGQRWTRLVLARVYFLVGARRTAAVFPSPTLLLRDLGLPQRCLNVGPVAVTRGVRGGLRASR